MIENGLWTIRYPNGRTCVWVEQFFPCPQERLKYLIKTTFKKEWILDLDECVSDILIYLKSKLEDLNPEVRLKELANRATTLETEANETQEKIDHLSEKIERLPKCKSRDNLEDELKSLKRIKRQQKSEVREKTEEFNQVKRMEKQYKANIDLIQKIV